MKKFGAFFLFLILNSCWFGAGTLGSFKSYLFVASEKKMNLEIENIYTSHPEYKMPKKWEPFDDWNERGFESLNGKIFYFGNSPEEMYYVSYYELNDNNSIKDGFKTTDISVRAVHNGTWRWKKEDDYEKDKKEKERIEKRFHDEIIVKLEKQMNTKAIEDNSWF
jgi:hypothetical protein